MQHSITYHKTAGHLVVKIANTNANFPNLTDIERTNNSFEVEHIYKDHDLKVRRIQKGNLKPQAEVVLLIKDTDLNLSHHILLVNHSLGVHETYFIPNRYIK